MRATINSAALFLSLVLFFLAVPEARVRADDNSHLPSVHKLVFGLFLHDRGPASDRHERGVDPNWEIQLKPPEWKYWKWIGSPAPMAGMTPNFNGDTSVFYAGLNYEFSLSNRFTDRLTDNLTKNLFVSGGLSAALHNGPLHKNKIGCEENSDCGFGYRVLPRVNVEFGTYFLGNQGISVFWDHMSHKGILPGENEGIDHIGVRYHLKFDLPKTIK
ncbi:MAG: acyloxyacyl hydrolase [Chloroflexota bacterium]